MQLDVLTPDKTVFSGEINLIQLPGSLGAFEIMKNHAPMIATLTDGPMKIEPTEGEALLYKITGGVAEVKANKIIVLAEEVQSN